MRFGEFRIGDTFHASCTTTEMDLDAYMQFARVKNPFLAEEDKKRAGRRVIPGRALLAKIEGEFTRLKEIYGNHIVLVGTDGDPGWGGRSTRFLEPCHTGDRLMIAYTISDVVDVDDRYGRIVVDCMVTDSEGSPVLISKRNIYRMKKV